MHDSLKNIIFVGGIHGVGKSTICQKLALDSGVIYLSASEVLKWKEINIDEKNKKVENIPATQDRLITGLNSIIKPDCQYILDGHFCLFNKDSVATKVPLATFAAINPMRLVVIVGDVVAISNGLANRDQKSYSENALANMQNLEMAYAREISNKINVPLFTFNKANFHVSYKNLLSQINESAT